MLSAKFLLKFKFVYYHSSNIYLVIVVNTQKYDLMRWLFWAVNTHKKYFIQEIREIVISFKDLGQR